MIRYDESAPITVVLSSGCWHAGLSYLTLTLSTRMMPAIFFGHGNPMNALTQNQYTNAWKRIAESLPIPRAILCVSAHWYIPSTSVTTNPMPRTIHDFGGFPKELYEIRYPAPGSPELAEQVKSALTPLRVYGDDHWGLDHGTWSVLLHAYPNANVPVVQLSIDETQPASFHFEIGTRLRAFRQQDVMIVGSGNLVHNLHTYAWGHHMPEPYEWAARFEKNARTLMSSGDIKPLIDYESLGRDAMLSIPTPDHYLPLLYVLGAREETEPITFPVEGIDGGSVSMLAVQIG